MTIPRIQRASVFTTARCTVALSYYPHPILDELYPEKWRRVTWETPKHSQRTKEHHDYAQELLLLNYPLVARTLWDEDIAS